MVILCKANCHRILIRNLFIFYYTIALCYQTKIVKNLLLIYKKNFFYCYLYVKHNFYADYYICTENNSK